jgi:3-deoxy-manno-octulosonate cytidylyltransferase (CMP-KDO synthetase)
MREKVLVVIPARMASSRFPGKPLAQICGRSMIERVWRIGQSARQAERVVIATDSQELRDFAEGFGAEVVMTSENCRTGTDRVAEASIALGGKHEIVFSLQGDAVLTPPWVIDDVLAAMREDQGALIATPAVKLAGGELSNFVAAKRSGVTTGTSVVFDRRGYALYFSKSLIPFAREEQHSGPAVFRHIGLYGYRRETLAEFARLPAGMFEQIEKLEQLRALENGIPIRVVIVDYRGRSHASVDRHEDVPAAEEIIRREGELVS